jgi:hypothetical protein
MPKTPAPTPENLQLFAHIVKQILIWTEHARGAAQLIRQSKTQLAINALE